MKSIDDMTPEERENFKRSAKAVDPFKRKSCYDCKHLYGAITLWCTNKNAISYRGTAIPGCMNCQFWQPDWKHIEKNFRTDENGYIKPTFWQRIKNLFR
jgi:hypothetical protein